MSEPGMSGNTLRRFVVYAFVSANIIALALLWFGVLGEVGFWRLLTFTSFGFWAIVMRQNFELLHEVDRWAALCTAQRHVIESVTGFSVVTCASCDNAYAHSDDDPQMPPGWDTRNGRPYCPVCLGRHQ